MLKNQDTTEQIQGVVERITYHHPETGFAVLRVHSKQYRDQITVLATVLHISVGEQINCVGCWEHNKKHGLQFKAQTLNIIRPTTLEGIEKYLASGMVKGIGAHYASKLVRAFGDAVFDVIENHPERLLELEGVGKKRQLQMISAIKEQHAVRDIMTFLQSHGIGTARAMRIYQRYGDQAVARISANPYCLIQDLPGVGFKTADTLALTLGIARHAPARAQAGIHHVLQMLCNKGHCAVSVEQLHEECERLLEIDADTIMQALHAEIAENHLILEDINDVPCIFSTFHRHAEESVAYDLHRIMQGEVPWGDINCDQALPWVESKTNIQLSPSQQEAIATVLQHKLAIITGGPGVGKTTIVNSLLKIVHANGVGVSLCAPTGRAAKRLTETTGLQAKTIHRMLGIDPTNFSFKHDRENPLTMDVVIVDETSMLDLSLLYHLLKAIPDYAALIFVGDVDQLPSVGPGAVLSDMIRAGCIPTVKLTEIFRQAAHSHIIMNAHRINRGELPEANTPTHSDFYTIYTQDAEETHDQVIALVAERLPQFMQCDPVMDIQVLSPMNRGGLGTITLNSALQQRLNQSLASNIVRHSLTLALGDKVIQTVNNYDKDIYNGDIGYVTHINSHTKEVKITFDQRVISYEWEDLDEVNLAYAISIHKSQGSEFPVVVIPITMQHHVLLARNLLYTGVTRGKNLVVLVGEKRAIRRAIDHHEANQRLTNLTARIVKACGQPL